MRTKNEKAPLHTKSLKAIADDDLGVVVGGLVFTFKLVAVKTIDWSGGGEELPKES